MVMSDEEKIVRILNENYKKIKNFSKKISGIRGIDPDDLTQIACIKIMQESHKFNPKKGTKESTFIMTIAKNAIIDEIRHQLTKLPKDEKGKPIGLISINTPQKAGLEENENQDSLVGKILNNIDNTETAEDKIIFENLVQKIKENLNPFDKLIFRCKVEPEKILDRLDDKGISLTQRAHHEYLQQIKAKKLGLKSIVTDPSITNNIICKHISYLLSNIPDNNGNFKEENITCEDINNSLARIKNTVKNVLDLL